MGIKKKCRHFVPFNKECVECGYEERQELEGQMRDFNFGVHDRWDYESGKEVLRFECTVCGKSFDLKPQAKHELQECFEAFAERVKRAMTNVKRAMTKEEF